MRKISLTLLLYFFVLSQANATNFFWVGGSGNWTDLNHWATTSGGAINPVVLPGIGDDVFFDGNSFSAAAQTVSLGAGDKYCRNMSWTGVTNNPAFNIAAAKMHVLGSLTLNANMSLTNTLTSGAGFYFEASTAGQTIRTFGKTLYYDVFFQGTGTASWTLQDELRAFNRIYIRGGVLNTGNQNITMMSSQSVIYLARSTFVGGAPIVANFGSSTITAQTVFTDYAIFGVTINPGTSTLTVQSLTAGDHNYYNVVFNGPGAVGFTGSPNNSGIYNNIDVNSGTDFTLEGGPTVNGRLRLGVPGLNTSIEAGTTTTFNGILESYGTLAQRVNIFSSSTGSPVTFQKSNGILCVEFITLRDNTKAGTGNFYASNSVDLGNNTGWNFTTQSCLSSLPVQLLSFDLNCSSGNLAFNWKTAMEINSSHFEIQKQTITGWVTIGNVKAAGESQSERTYRFQSVEQSDVYRLVSVDLDGKKSYSAVRTLRCGDIENISLINNPVQNELDVRIKSLKNERIHFQIINSSGQVVRKEEVMIITGINQHKFNLFALPTGMYILNIPSKGKKILFVKMK